MLSGKHVCGQASDAFVLRLHDVSGTLLKINLSRSFIDELYIGGLNGFLCCYFSADVRSWCLSEPNTGGGTYPLLRARHVYSLLLPLSVFLDVYSGNIKLYDETIYSFFKLKKIVFLSGLSSSPGIPLLRLLATMDYDLNF